MILIDQSPLRREAEKKALKGLRETVKLRDTLAELAEHCQGDNRPDCPILKELESGTGCR